MSLDAPEPLDGVEEPGLATHRQVEAAVAVRDDVEPRRFLGIDDGGHRVEILLAEHRVAERGLERPAGQVRVVPERAGIRAGDGGRQHQVACHAQHAVLPGDWERRRPRSRDVLARDAAPAVGRCQGGGRPKLGESILT